MSVGAFGTPGSTTLRREGQSLSSPATCLGRELADGGQLSRVEMTTKQILKGPLQWTAVREAILNSTAAGPRAPSWSYQIRSRSRTPHLHHPRIQLSHQQ